jgi:transcriptional regulator with XRE-family HTH domain
LSAHPTHESLGAFLKSVRAKTRPESLGLHPGRRRRAPGLRREEVALAAGISVTWYTWIEQGRPMTCSRTTLACIADALRMTRAERAHLFDLAGSADEAPAHLSRQIPVAIQALADALTLHPVYIVNGRWDVLHFNAACAALLGPFDTASPITSNVLRRLFLDERWRVGFEDWSGTAASAVAQFRAATGALWRDDSFGLFVAQLADESAEFRALWNRRQLELSPVKAKVFTHPRVGRVAMDYATMKPDVAADDVRLVLYVPRAESTSAIQRLMARRSADAPP